MQQDNLSLTDEAKQVIKSKCSICNQDITDKDLITVSKDDGQELIMHFKCYVEIQEKMCSECGIPFYDQEKVWFCEEHREYLHINNKCILRHLAKHVSFKVGIYDIAKNRVSFLENEEFDSIL